MILIADSGSTKTDWICLDSQKNILFDTQTQGLNPQILNYNNIEQRIVNNFQLYQKRKYITHLYFYGAGCGTDVPRKLIKKVFESIFENSRIIVKEDTYAAVYSTVTVGSKSIVSILGTGSNCTYYDGTDIVQKITSMGYILMDDASGNYYGRQMLKDYFFNKMPPELALKFSKEYKLDPNIVKDTIYKKPNPQAYLATYAKFLIDNKSNNYCLNLINKGISLFISNQIEQFEDCKKIPLHFIGSIAYYLKDELNEALKTRGMILGRILKKPKDGLILYHKELIK
tara:strand:+ start:5243 stop:6097 length:855 start_codon:yes stop_codon:yes gene_type:complete